MAYYFTDRPEVEVKSTEQKWAVKLTPRVDVIEKSDEIILLVDMPGMDREHLKVQVEDGILSLSGKKKSLPRGGKYLWKEIPEAVYERAFQLEDDVDPEQIQASYEKGVLELRLKKKGVTKPIEITVN